MNKGVSSESPQVPQRQAMSDEEYLNSEFSSFAPANTQASQDKGSERLSLIHAENLTVKYENRFALDAVSFDIFEGEVFALLGSNGAGKSTILSCISRIKRNYDGSLLVLGKEAKHSRNAVLSTVALVQQEYSFFRDFTVFENLRFACNSFNIANKETNARIQFLLEEYKLEKFRDIKAKNLSGGYKRLLNIAMSVVKDPKIILLDEPTAGLDIEMRELINKIIKKFKRNGITVVLTTHYLEDVEQVSDRVALLSLGKLVAIGPIGELIAQKGGPYLVVLSDIGCPMESLEERMGKLKHFDKIVALEDRFYLVAPQKNIGMCMKELSGVFAAAGTKIGKIEIHEPSLNKVFLGIVGHHK